jgi:hypothetical protein
VDTPTVLPLVHGWEQGDHVLFSCQNSSGHGVPVQGICVAGFAVGSQRASCRVHMGAVEPSLVVLRETHTAVRVEKPTEAGPQGAVHVVQLDT